MILYVALPLACHAEIIFFGEKILFATTVIPWPKGFELYNFELYNTEVLFIPPS